jgi:ribosome-associated protein
MSYRYSKIKIQWFVDTIRYKEVEISTAKSSGPWWQHVNKTETKIQLSRPVTKTSIIPDPYKQRFIEAQAQYITDEGNLRINASVHRTQDTNKELVRKKLKNMIFAAFKTPKAPRKMTKPPKHAVDARIAEKKRRSKTRANRTKFTFS